MNIWQWLADLAPAQATVLGTGLGAVLGFGTLAAGALLNAQFNRRRDIFLHRMQQLNLLRSLTIEISQISSLVRHQLSLLHADRGSNVDVSIINPSTLAVVYPNNLSQLHHLPPQTLIRVIPFYVGLWEHEYNVALCGGEKIGGHGELRSFTFGQQQIARVIELNEHLEALCHQTLKVCWPVLQKMELELEGSANTIKETREKGS